MIITSEILMMSIFIILFNGCLAFAMIEQDKDKVFKFISIILIAFLSFVIYLNTVKYGITLF